MNDPLERSYVEEARREKRVRLDREAIHRRDEVARLFDLSRDVLLATDSREALPAQLRRAVTPLSRAPATMTG